MLPEVITIYLQGHWWCFCMLIPMFVMLGITDGQFKKRLDIAFPDKGPMGANDPVANLILTLSIVSILTFFVGVCLLVFS